VAHHLLAVPVEHDHEVSSLVQTATPFSLSSSHLQTGSRIL
jgi:hypothetical protein